MSKLDGSTPEAGEGARVARYAEAIQDVYAWLTVDEVRAIARVVMDVADQETAELRAEVERLRAVEFIHAGCRGLREKDNAYLLARAEAAEAESARLASVVAKVEALMARPHGPRSIGGIHLPAYVLVSELRRALASVATDTATPGERPRRFDQCDDRCTTDCGHCKGKGLAASSADDKAGE